MADEKTIEELQTENAALTKSNETLANQLDEASVTNSEKDDALLEMSEALEASESKGSDKDPVVLTRGKRKVVLTIPRAQITIGKGRDKKVILVTEKSLKEDDKLFDKLLKMRYGGFEDYVAPKKEE